MDTQKDVDLFMSLPSESTPECFVPNLNDQYLLDARMKKKCPEKVSKIKLQSKYDESLPL
jgi:hypothetical protein